MTESSAILAPVRRVLCTACVLLVLVALPGCASRDEVRRVPSPGYPLEAVLVERNAGATMSLFYEIYIVPTGGSTWRAGDPVVQIMMGGDESIQLEWKRPNSLVVTCCDEAVLSQFRNLWAGPDAGGGRRVVQVQLQSPSGTTPPLPQRAFY